jgi:hypothetical protein
MKQHFEDVAGAVMIFAFVYFAWMSAYLMEPM